MNRISRFFAPLVEDLREYHLPRCVTFCKASVMWALAAAVAFLTLPMDPARRTRLVKKLGNVVGEYFWGLRDVSWLREHFPPMRNLVRVEVYSPEGTLKFRDFGFNLRTNEGRDWQCQRMGDTANPAAANWIAVHNSSSYTPAAGDVASGWDANQVPASSGFGRAQGTYNHTNGQGNYTLAKTYTASAAVTVYGAALLNTSGPTGGTLFVTRNFGTQATMITNDTLAVTWDITV